MPSLEGRADLRETTSRQRIEFSDRPGVPCDQFRSSWNAEPCPRAAARAGWLSGGVIRSSARCWSCDFRPRNPQGAAVWRCRPWPARLWPAATVVSRNVGLICEAVKRSGVHI